MSDPTGLHRPLDASRLHNIVVSGLRSHRDVASVELHRSTHADRLVLNVVDWFGNGVRVDFYVPPWSRP